MAIYRANLVGQFGHSKRFHVFSSLFTQKEIMMYLQICKHWRLKKNYDEISTIYRNVEKVLINFGKNRTELKCWSQFQILTVTIAFHMPYFEEERLATVAKLIIL